MGRGPVVMKLHQTRVCGLENDEVELLEKVFLGKGW
jgi:hypothetical protein